MFVHKVVTLLIYYEYKLQTRTRVIKKEKGVLYSVFLLVTITQQYGRHVKKFTE